MSDQGDSVAFGRTYAWNFFALHENERIQMFNYWLVATAFLATAWVQAVVNSLRGVALCLALTGLLTSLAFYRLDARTRRLVLLGEEALRDLEADLAADIGHDSIRLIHHADQARSFRVDSYRIIIESLQLFAASAFFGAGVYALIR